MEFICLLLTLYLVVVFARIIMSWIRIGPDSPAAPIAGAVIALTDPVMRPLRQIIPPVRMGGIALDLSALVLVFGIQIHNGVIC